MRRRLILNETGFISWRFLLPTLSTSILFFCFWSDLVCVLATTGNTSAVAGYGVYKYTKIQGPRFQKNYIIARDQKSDLHVISIIAENKPHAHHKNICIQWKFTTPYHRIFGNWDSYFFRPLSCAHLFQCNERFQVIEFVDLDVSGKL